MIEISRNNVRLINIEEIKKAPGPYCMSFGFDPVHLERSIKEIGMINPILIIKDPQNGFDIVSGYRRLIALISLGKDKVTSIDLSDTGLSERQLFFLNLYENLATRQFNIVEKGMIINQLRKYIDNNEIISNYFPMLGISRINDLEVFLRITRLSDQHKNFINKGLLSLKAIRRIIELNENSRSALIELIANLKLNFNYQFQLTEYLIDISEAESVSIDQILNKEPFQKILMDPNTNNPQKTKHLFALLRDRKFPLLSRNEKIFRKRVADLNLPDRTRIEPPLYFEGPDFRLEILFRDGNELLKRLKHLSRCDSLTSINPPWFDEDEQS